MNDLISRQAAIDAIENAFDRETILNRFVRKIAISAVRLLPSAQPEKVCIAKITLSEEQVREAVEKAKSEIVQVLSPAQPEIIRCKDCKWYGRVDKRRFYRGMDCLQKHIDTIVPDRDFCSKAEMRGE